MKGIEDSIGVSKGIMYPPPTLIFLGEQPIVIFCHESNTSCSILDGQLSFTPGIIFIPKGFYITRIKDCIIYKALDYLDSEESENIV